MYEYEIEQEPCGIEDGDYTLTPSGSLGGRTTAGQVGGKYVAEYDTTEDALDAVRREMQREQWWPTIWWVSDHGNAWPIDLDGNEIT